MLFETLLKMLGQDLPQTVKNPIADCIFNFGHNDPQKLKDWLQSGSIDGILELSQSQKYKLLEILATTGDCELIDQVIGQDHSDIA